MKTTEMIFGGNLEIEDLTTGIRPRVKLIEAFRFWVSHKGNEKVLTIPAEFISDCATTPWILWRFAPPFGPWNRAAVVHDFLCVHREHAAELLGWPKPISSVDAAEWFEAGLIACRRDIEKETRYKDSKNPMSLFRIFTMYNTVRWFGPKWEG